MGSSVMRQAQLSKHMKRYFDDVYDVSAAYISSNGKALICNSLHYRFPDATFVFSKMAANIWRSKDFGRLRKRARAILVDYVDAPISRVRISGVDVHLVTSHAGARLWQRHKEALAAKGERVEGRVAVVLHNYDDYLDTIPPAPTFDACRIAYLGDASKTVVTPTVQDMVTFLPAETRDVFERNIGRIGAFNAHFGVRRGRGANEPDVASPFTKGITAAALGAPILTDRGTDDAQELLGADYPFLISDNAPETIDEGLRYMHDAYGGSDWIDALARMADLRNKTTHRAICGQLHEVIQSVQ